MDAIIHRTSKQLQCFMQQHADWHARKTEQRRWRSEQGDSRAMYDSIVMFMNDANQARWLSGTRRYTAECTTRPTPVGHGINLHGWQRCLSAVPPKLGHKPPPTGYGFKAVTGGTGESGRILAGYGANESDLRVRKYVLSDVFKSQYLPGPPRAGSRKPPAAMWTQITDKLEPSTLKKRFS